MLLKSPLLLAAIIAAFFVAGCGDDNKSDSASAGEQATETTGATSDTASTDTGEPGKPPKVSGSLEEAPEIATPEGSPPEELIVKDIKKGDGKKAELGDTVKVQYVGLNWSNGQEFDSSWSRGQAADFPLEEGGLIAGWTEGLPGMREGGRRMLVVPPDKGYGAQGQPPSIPGNETLIFVVDLVAVN